MGLEVDEVVGLAGVSTTLDTGAWYEVVAELVEVSTVLPAFVVVVVAELSVLVVDEVTLVVVVAVDDDFVVEEDDTTFKVSFSTFLTRLVNLST